MSRICDIQNSLEANRGPVFSKHKCGLFSNETNVYIHIYIYFPYMSKVVSSHADICNYLFFCFFFFFAQAVIN